MVWYLHFYHITSTAASTTNTVKKKRLRRTMPIAAIVLSSCVILSFNFNALLVETPIFTPAAPAGTKGEMALEYYILVTDLTAFPHGNM